MDKKPTFEDLVGNTDAQEWTNDVSDGELSIVSALANKQLEIATEVAKLEADLKSLLMSFITLIYRRQTNQ